MTEEDKKFMEQFNAIEIAISVCKNDIGKVNHDWASELKTLTQRNDYEANKMELLNELGKKYAAKLVVLENELSTLQTKERILLIKNKGPLK